MRGSGGAGRVDKLRAQQCRMVGVALLLLAAAAAASLAPASYSCTMLASTAQRQGGHGWAPAPRACG